jgi:ABC-2 type transport system ATP-binding protein
MTSMELEIDGLRRRYGTVTALDGLTFGVPAGQVFGFLGPNGAGKTTTMRAIFGVTALDAGEIRWRGKPVDEAARRTFGYMPEERGLYPAMALFDQVEYFARLHGMDGTAAEKAAWHWIDRLGLSAGAGRGSTRSRTATSSAPSWPSRLSTIPTCWSSTSRSPASIPAASTT